MELAVKIKIVHTKAINISSIASLKGEIMLSMHALIVNTAAIVSTISFLICNFIRIYGSLLKFDLSALK